MQDQFSRTRLLLGSEGMERLVRARVAVFGVGGVGGYVCEGLARCGIGTLDLIDNDRICLTNINRQIPATVKTIGQLKAEVMAERIREINPDARVFVHDCFVLPENVESFPFRDYDYVADAVDTVAAKIALVLRARDTGTPVISAMGAGNKLDPTRFRIADLYETRMDPLSRVMRRELKKRGVDRLKVVYSDEEPLRPRPDPDASPETLPDNSARREIPGSVSFVPSVAGLIMAGEIVRDLLLLPPRSHS